MNQYLVGMQSETEDHKQEVFTTTHFYLSQHPALVTMEAPSAPIGCKLCSLLFFLSFAVILIAGNKGNIEKKISTPQYVHTQAHVVPLSVSQKAAAAETACVHPQRELMCFCDTLTHTEICNGAGVPKNMNNRHLLQ